MITEMDQALDKLIEIEHQIAILDGKDLAQYWREMSDPAKNGLSIAMFRNWYNCLSNEITDKIYKALSLKA
jgi:hypothetical protein